MTSTKNSSALLLSEERSVLVLFFGGNLIGGEQALSPHHLFYSLKPHTSASQLCVLHLVAGRLQSAEIIVATPRLWHMYTPPAAAVQLKWVGGCSKNATQLHVFTVHNHK